ncbi:MAG TPA: hypothetical protein PKB00_00860 [Microthrixaceae bacterium]|nr:MAG: hypothetical protein EKK60_15530 [Gordonia sp. (in: high G+C Gram-positive bacteria)]HMV73097.1 hypothetical protein [Microthrixaceae bacterium]HNA35244.1 hypothetical protein [Microthrixaceae bacterium]HNG23043.1 hypothetical protein [Microthrixaceae bacterium]HNH37053.1 hypothetical protein [Microthrixaceae bacterium]
MIHRLHLDDVEMPVRLATLVVVDRGAATVDWEVVAEGLADFTGELGRIRVEMLCITGANESGQLLLGELCGEAIVVRFVGATVVLRGDGPLHGLSDAVLEG